MSLRTEIFPQRKPGLFVTFRKICVVALLTSVMVGCASGTGGSKPLHATGRPLDVAIDGPGYFIVQLRPREFVFTRRGRFYIDISSTLVTDAGYALVPPIKLPTGVAVVTIGPTGEISVGRIHTEQTADAEPHRSPPDAKDVDVVGVIKLAVFDDPTRLIKDGDYYFVSAKSGEPRIVRPGDGRLVGRLITGRLEKD